MTVATPSPYPRPNPPRTLPIPNPEPAPIAEPPFRVLAYPDPVPIPSAPPALRPPKIELRSGVVCKFLDFSSDFKNSYGLTQSARAEAIKKAKVFVFIENLII